MRLYTASCEETLRARKLLTDWAADGILTQSQYERLEQQTTSELRTTNIFLRVVLFLFTLISVGGAVALVLVISRPSEQTAGILFLIVAGVCYAAAEVAVSKFRLHHHGIEEALAVYSAGFLTVGILLAFLNGARYSPTSDRLESVVIIAGAVFSLWIWHRFGLWYAFLAAMVFAIFLPGYWTSSHSVQHVILDLLYALGLICVTVVRSRHRFDYLDDSYSLVEALLWLGIYLVTNLQLSSLDVRMH